MHPGVVRGALTRGGRPVCVTLSLCVSGARRAGGYRLSRPCSGEIATTPASLLFFALARDSCLPRGRAGARLAVLAGPGAGQSAFSTGTAALERMSVDWSALPDFTASGGTLRMAGQPVVLKGVNWFGAEEPEMVPNGLWAHSMAWYLDFIKQSGFNAIRVPFALDNVQSNLVPSVNMISASPELGGLNFLDMLEELVDGAANNGLLVLFDLHRLKSTRWPDDGLWYTAGVSMNEVKAVWDTMQARFCNRWNVIGADLLNEPHGAKWGEWADAATDMGNFVLSKCARWLVFVEGVAHEGKSRSEFFWGENLEGAAHSPVRLSTANKLVYSPHVRLRLTSLPQTLAVHASAPRALAPSQVYGPGDGSQEHHMPYFDDKKFPSNMDAIWHRHFGYLASAGHTVIVGEWGGFYAGKDRIWQDEFAKYLQRNQLSSFYWCLNPNSGDTGCARQPLVPHLGRALTSRVPACQGSAR